MIRLRRGYHVCLQYITHYIDRRNIDPKPFVWTASVRQILKKLNKGHKTLATLH